MIWFEIPFAIILFPKDHQTNQIGTLSTYRKEVQVLNSIKLVVKIMQ